VDRLGPIFLQRTFQRYGYAGDSGSMVVRLRYGEPALVGLTESAHTPSIHGLRLTPNLATGNAFPEPLFFLGLGLVTGE
jgi:hypothetical protein